MPPIKDLRRRLRSVKSTQKITRAMETVSGVKLKRASDRLHAAQPYLEKLQEVIVSLVADESVAQHPLCEVREVKHRSIVVIAADRGLCGAFNAVVLKDLDDLVAELGRDQVDVVPVGKRAVEHCKRRKCTVELSHTPLGDAAQAGVAQELGRALSERFTAGETDEVLILSHRMRGSAASVPKRAPLLPIALESDGDDGASAGPALNYIFEPSAGEVLGAALPRTVEARLLLAMAESIVAEQSARRMAMHNATENCKELSQRLTLQINRARQAAITKEILEIVGGAEALKG